MQDRSEVHAPWRHYAASLFILIPVTSLFLNALSWLRFGIDLPFLDDWRPYGAAFAESFDLAYLFLPGNDTLYPVGKALDALAQRFLDGNSIAYQFLSMVAVLGTLLLLQWRLLVLALSDRLIAAAAFVLTLFMIQPGTYWGLQSLAYHQAIPLVCLLLILFVVLRPLRPSLLVFLLVFGLSLIGGLAYISGAVVIPVAGIVLLALAPSVEPAERRPITWGGFAALAGGLSTIVVQLWAFIAWQGGKLHSPSVSWGLPLDRDFWLFILGKIARSLGLSDLPPLMAFVLALILSCLALALAWVLLRRNARRAPQPLAEARLALVYVVLVACMASYLMIVAAGRANFGKPMDESFLVIFQFGYVRFYFFWVTLFWPWMAAATLAVVFNRFGRGKSVAAIFVCNRRGCGGLAKRGLRSCQLLPAHQRTPLGW